MNDDMKKGARLLALALLTGAIGADDESDVCASLAQLTEGALRRITTGAPLTGRDFGGAADIGADHKAHAPPAALLLEALETCELARTLFEDAR